MKQVKPIIWGTAIIALGIIFDGNVLGRFGLDFSSMAGGHNVGMDG